MMNKLDNSFAKNLVPNSSLHSLTHWTTYTTRLYRVCVRFSHLLIVHLLFYIYVADFIVFSDEEDQGRDQHQAERPSQYVLLSTSLFLCSLSLSLCFLISLQPVSLLCKNAKSGGHQACPWRASSSISWPEPNKWTKTQEWAFPRFFFFQHTQCLLHPLSFSFFCLCWPLAFSCSFLFIIEVGPSASSTANSLKRSRRGSAGECPHVTSFIHSFIITSSSLLKNGAIKFCS